MAAKELALATLSCLFTQGSVTCVLLSDCTGRGYSQLPGSDVAETDASLQRLQVEQNLRCCKHAWELTHSQL